jgi:hypothetical protein
MSRFSGLFKVLSEKPFGIKYFGNLLADCADQDYRKKMKELLCCLSQKVQESHSKKNPAEIASKEIWNKIFNDVLSELKKANPARESFELLQKAIYFSNLPSFFNYRMRAYGGSDTLLFVALLDKLTKIITHDPSERAEKDWFNPSIGCGLENVVSCAITALEAVHPSKPILINEKVLLCQSNMLLSLRPSWNLSEAMLKWSVDANNPALTPLARMFFSFVLKRIAPPGVLESDFLDAQSKSTVDPMGALVGFGNQSQFKINLDFESGLPCIDFLGDALDVTELTPILTGDFDYTYDKNLLSKTSYKRNIKILLDQIKAKKVPEIDDNKKIGRLFTDEFRGISYLFFKEVILILDTVGKGFGVVSYFLVKDDESTKFLFSFGNGGWGSGSFSVKDFLPSNTIIKAMYSDWLFRVSCMSMSSKWRNNKIEMRAISMVALFAAMNSRIRILEKIADLMSRDGQTIESLSNAIMMTFFEDEKRRELTGPVAVRSAGSGALFSPQTPQAGSLQEAVGQETPISRCE